MSSAPKPEVVYLPAIFRDIRKGITRIPAFQRGFVWKQRQSLELLESVYRSYPIGSLLFWHVDVREMKTDKTPKVPFPHPDVSGPVDFVLDGMQRISTLFGAFHARVEIGSADPFDFVFDLQDRAFRPASERTETSISLRVLFSPKELLAEQARLGELNSADILIDQSLHLQRVFQEYLLPVVRIGERLPEEVVEIFERVNSTGTRLSAVDFMRALTWSTAFDLSEQIGSLADVASERGYEIPPDVFAKSIALSLGVVPTASEMLGLRGRTPLELAGAAQRTRAAVEAALEFLSTELGILSYDYVPYEGQFLVVASVAAATRGMMPDWLKSWFWRVAFSEAMQGRPDHAIAKLAIDAGKTPGTSLVEHFSLTEADLSLRGVRKGAAISMAMVAAIATRPACSIFTGQPIPAEDLMMGYEPGYIGAVFSKTELASVLEPSPRGNRIIANTIILASQERRPFPRPEGVRSAIVALSERDGGAKALDTQCITSDCVDAIRAGDVNAFLTARAQAMLELASRLSGAE